MLNLVNSTQQLSFARLYEFFSEQKHWYRSLWGIGTVLAMDELVEACTVMKQGHLSEGSVKRIASSLLKRVGSHPAFAIAEKHLLAEQVRQVPRAEGVAHFIIRELCQRVSSDYLSRWAAAVAGGNFRPEHFARHVGAHLLDAGFSPQFLHDWIASRRDAPETITLAELCEELQGVVQSNPPRPFDVLIAVKSMPRLNGASRTPWLKAAAVTEWLRQNRFDTAGVRAAAAMIVTVTARDDVGAASAARNESDRYSARALLATGKPLDLLPSVWVRGSSREFPAKTNSRGVAVSELFRGDRIFASGVSQNVDAALELLAHLEDSSPPAAIAGGWGAIEGLLADPSDRASAADNLATLVTCSFPRAELTALSRRAERIFPSQCAELLGVETNRERSRVLARMILENRVPAMPSVADQAAVARMRKLLLNPHPELQTIKDLVAESFHRLYRQRNLILHGGRLDSVALHASLRTVAKLAGAGMDRITHGHYEQGLRPLELVAKANLALAVIDRASPLECVDLLEVA
ncbi:integrase [Trinickia dabaoshanensis]|uniref:Integrase n=1 Tax=Trinickia dabaoshanensis TaxID=564714 RepID=A0A2N7VPL0_9BURK|nr:integrase [Trinickia dabaoshanensis]PMS19093.1 integrase [Trinickia dabaoshanensis]